MSDPIYGIVWRMPMDPTPVQALIERAIHRGNASELEAAAAMAMGGRVHAIGSTYTSRADLYDEEGRYAGSITGHTVTLTPHLPDPPVRVEKGSPLSAYLEDPEQFYAQARLSRGLAESEAYEFDKLADLLHPKPQAAREAERFDTFYYVANDCIVTVMSVIADGMCQLGWLDKEGAPRVEAVHTWALADETFFVRVPDPSGAQPSPSPEFLPGDRFVWNGKREGDGHLLILVRSPRPCVWDCQKFENHALEHVVRDEHYLRTRYRRLPRK